MNEFYRGFVKGILNPVYDTVRGTNRKKYRKTLEKTQWYKPEEIIKIQTQNLRRLVKEAYENVPYYNRLFKEYKVHPDDIKTPEDMTKIPVLNKLDIQSNQQELHNIEFSSNTLIPSNSGGTGNSIKFDITKEKISWEIAAEYRAYGWAGYELGDKCTMFWGSPHDVPVHRKFEKRVTDWLERLQVHGTYILRENILEEQIDKMRKFKPEIVRGYASSVYFTARKMLQDGIDDVTPRAVITSAESLLPNYRETIEEAFGCQVFDYYGSREVGAMASECEEHSGFHVSAENVLLEFIKDGEHVSPSEQGEIVVTNLRNHGMPFIRYAIADVGKPSDEQCACGRGLPLIKSIDGRTSQFISIYDKENDKISPVLTANPGIIPMHFSKVPIETYRIYQENLEKIVVKLVPMPEYTEKDTEFLYNFFETNIGKYINVEIQLVEEVPPLPSGKRSVVVSKINPFN